MLNGCAGGSAYADNMTTSRRRGRREREGEERRGQEQGRNKFPHMQEPEIGAKHPHFWSKDLATNHFR